MHTCIPYYLVTIPIQNIFQGLTCIRDMHHTKCLTKKADFQWLSINL